MAVAARKKLHKNYTVADVVEFMVAEVIGQGAFVFFGDKGRMKGRPVRSKETIRRLVSRQKHTYMTFNGFNLPWCGKTGRNLQVIAAITVDVDERLPLDELLDAVAATGLEAPTLIAETDRGYHLSWKLDGALRAYPAHQVFVKAVTAAIIEELQRQGIAADTSYRTPERYTRVPYRVAWFRPVAYSLQFFTDWVEINGLKLKKGGYRSFGKVAIVGDILTDPAVQKLMEGVRVGIRNESAYALALCHRAEGFTLDETVPVLLAWNRRNEEPLPVKELLDTIDSAFRYNKLPSPKIIESLSGIKPRFRVVRAACRKSSAQEKVVAILARNGGELATTYDKLAELCGVSRRTLFRHIQELKKGGIIAVRTSRKGKKGSVTVFSLITEDSTAAGESQPFEGKISNSSRENFPGTRAPGRQQPAVPGAGVAACAGAGMQGHARAAPGEPARGHPPAAAAGAGKKGGDSAVGDKHVFDHNFWNRRRIDLGEFANPPLIVLPAGPELDFHTAIEKTAGELKLARGTRVPREERRRLMKLRLPELIRELEQVAAREYDGHFTLFRFTTDWRCCFGTPREINPLVTKGMGAGKTAEEAIRETIIYRLDTRFAMQVEEMLEAVINAILAAKKKKA